MNTITIDSNTYRDMETFAYLHNTDIADVVRKSFEFFTEKLKQVKPKSQKVQYELPSHLKKMRGVLASVEDPADERLNYILSK